MMTIPMPWQDPHTFVPEVRGSQGGSGLGEGWQSNTLGGHSMPQDQGERIDSYIDELFIPDDAALRDALDSARAHGLPAIGVPPALGRLLGILVRSTGARRVLEIGTLGG